MPHRTWTDEDLKREVPLAYSFQDLYRRLNIYGAHYTEKAIKNRITSLQLETSHFTSLQKIEKGKRTKALGLKTCSECKKEKELTAFSFKDLLKRTRAHICRTCQLEVSKAHYRKNKENYKRRAVAFNQIATKRNKENVLNYLRVHPCTHCGEKDPIVLDFHHLKDKEHNVSAMISSNGMRWETIEKEIDKCIVLCANCHRRVTAKEQNTAKYQASV